MEENTEILPVKKDADLGSSYTEYMRQFQIAEDEALINEAFIVEEDLEEQPDVMPLPGDTDPDTDFLENKPAEELGALGIAQQLLVGGPLKLAALRLNSICRHWIRHWVRGNYSAARLNCLWGRLSQKGVR